MIVNTCILHSLRFCQEVGGGQTIYYPSTFKSGKTCAPVPNLLTHMPEVTLYHLILLQNVILIVVYTYQMQHFVIGLQLDQQLL